MRAFLVLLGASCPPVGSGSRHLVLLYKIYCVVAGGREPPPVLGFSQKVERGQGFSAVGQGKNHARPTERGPQPKRQPFFVPKHLERSDDGRNVSQKVEKTRPPCGVSGDRGEARTPVSAEHVSIGLQTAGVQSTRPFSPFSTARSSVFELFFHLKPFFLHVDI